MPWRNSTYEFSSSFAQSLLFSSTVTSTAANETLRHDISKKNSISVHGAFGNFAKQYVENQCCFCRVWAQGNSTTGINAFVRLINEPAVPILLSRNFANG